MLSVPIQEALHLFFVFYLLHMSYILGQIMLIDLAPN